MDASDIVLDGEEGFAGAGAEDILFCLADGRFELMSPIPRKKSSFPSARSFPNSDRNAYTAQP